MGAAVFGKQLGANDAVLACERGDRGMTTGVERGEQRPFGQHAPMYRRRVEYAEQGADVAVACAHLDPAAPCAGAEA